MYKRNKDILYFLVFVTRNTCSYMIINIIYIFYPLYQRKQSNGNALKILCGLQPFKEELVSLCPKDKFLLAQEKTHTKILPINNKKELFHKE